MITEYIIRAVEILFIVNIIITIIKFQKGKESFKNLALFSLITCVICGLLENTIFQVHQNGYTMYDFISLSMPDDLVVMIMGKTMIWMGLMAFLTTFFVVKLSDLK